MASISDGYFKTELETRRRRLTSAIETSPTAEITNLLAEVDSALERLAVGTFGICESCHDAVEFERLPILLSAFASTICQPKSVAHSSRM